MSKREVDYYRWNTEARILVSLFPLVFIVTCVIDELGYGKVAALFFCPALALLSTWNLTYLWRAGEQRRKLIEFHRAWGPPQATERAAARQPR